MSERPVSSGFVRVSFVLSRQLLSRIYFICDRMIVCHRLASAASVSAYWNIYDDDSADSL